MSTARTQAVTDPQDAGAAARRAVGAGGAGTRLRPAHRAARASRGQCAAAWQRTAFVLGCARTR